MDSSPSATLALRTLALRLHPKPPATPCQQEKTRPSPGSAAGSAEVDETEAAGPTAPATPPRFMSRLELHHSDRSSKRSSPLAGPRPVQTGTAVPHRCPDTGEPHPARPPDWPECSARTATCGTASGGPDRWRNGRSHRASRNRNWVFPSGSTRATAAGHTGGEIPSAPDRGALRSLQSPAR